MLYKLNLGSFDEDPFFDDSSVSQLGQENPDEGAPPAHGRSLRKRAQSCLFDGRRGLQEKEDMIIINKFCKVHSINFYQIELKGFKWI